MMSNNGPQAVKTSEEQSKLLSVLTPDEQHCLQLARTILFHGKTVEQRAGITTLLQTDQHEDNLPEPHAQMTWLRELADESVLKQSCSTEERLQLIQRHLRIHQNINSLDANFVYQALSNYSTAPLALTICYELAIKLGKTEEAEQIFKQAMQALGASAYYLSETAAETIAMIAPHKSADEVYHLFKLFIHNIDPDNSRKPREYAFVIPILVKKSIHLFSDKLTVSEMIAPLFERQSIVQRDAHLIAEDIEKALKILVGNIPNSEHNALFELLIKKIDCEQHWNKPTALKLLKDSVNWLSEQQLSIAIEQILPCLEHKDWNTRYCALKVLKKIIPKLTNESAKTLIKGFKAKLESDIKQTHVAMAIGACAIHLEQEQMDDLFKLFINHFRDENIGSCYIRALLPLSNRLNNEQLTLLYENLVGLLSHPRFEYTWAATEVLATIADRLSDQKITQLFLSLTVNLGYKHIDVIFVTTDAICKIIDRVQSSHIKILLATLKEYMTSNNWFEKQSANILLEKLAHQLKGKKINSLLEPLLSRISHKDKYSSKYTIKALAAVMPWLNKKNLKQVASLIKDVFDVKNHGHSQLALSIYKTLLEKLEPLERKALFESVLQYFNQAPADIQGTLLLALGHSYQYVPEYQEVLAKDFVRFLKSEHQHIRYAALSAISLNWSDFKDKIIDIDLSKQLVFQPGDSLLKIVKPATVETKHSNNTQALGAIKLT